MLTYPTVRTSLVLFVLSFVIFLNGCTHSQSPSVAEEVTLASTNSNLILGVHAIGGPYQLTNEPYLLEVAKELESMGSSIIKFTATPAYTKRPYFMEEEDGIHTLRDLLEKHSVYKQVLSMNFRDYFFWASPFGEITWGDGLSVREKKDLYQETYEMAEYLLTHFNGTGKVFHVGHWEGDWLLLPSRDPNDTPSPERIAGFTDYLKVRQKAIVDARNSIPHDKVAIYHYAEVNLVMKGIDGKKPTLTNTVIPQVDLDFVSYSSYDTIQGSNMGVQVKRALDHIEEMMIPRPDWEGKRVYAGEFAIRASLVDFDPEEHDRRNREVMLAFLEWGSPYLLYWQMYCNEPKTNLEEGYNGFWLIDPNGKRYPLYYTFSNYWKAVRSYIETYTADFGHPPSDETIRNFAINYFTL